jgi:hypothetical protein
MLIVLRPVFVQVHHTAGDDQCAGSAREGLVDKIGRSRAKQLSNVSGPWIFVALLIGVVRSLKGGRANEFARGAYIRHLAVAAAISLRVVYRYGSLLPRYTVRG